MKIICDYIKNIYIKGGFHVIAGQFSIKFVSFLGSIFIVRLLSKDDYGVLAYYENIYNYFFIFAGLGLSNAILRYIVIKDESELKYSYFRFILTRSIIIDIFIVLLIGIISFFYPHPFEYENYRNILIFMAISLPFQDISQIAIFNERANFSNKRFATISLLLSFSIIVGKILGAAFGGIVSVVMVTSALYLVWGGLLLWWENKEYYSNFHIIRLTENERKEVCSYGFQYMLTNGLWILFALNDTFLLGRLVTVPSALAEYKVAHAVPANLSIFSTAIGIVVGPYFVKHENDDIWVKEKFKKILIACTVIVGIACVIIALLCKLIIEVLYGEEYLSVVPLMRAMLLPVFLNSAIRYTIANILAAMGKVKINLICAIFGTIIQICIDLLLIPIYGAIGIVASNTCAYLFMSVFLLCFYKKRFFIRKEGD